ncbi:uncharacterized protein THITE_2093364 [Thermothielavioides terrestris NRRL 8126]|uniref:Uncharacterized protein n=1 Tax=Thermothielavioides terrestris (strain ATCC 38088 / NRRL 8126) TaxID=578455 RepID=G2RGI0_THETT|nr:uncharacterized protein THITE_2093364 [Thermothielavioides terrestris NRRL 8126]AEO71869.1 hypothetical protein THITE_2093364 [Thermothielavioides terrestris NRRL 8126]
MNGERNGKGPIPTETTDVETDAGGDRAHGVSDELEIDEKTLARTESFEKVISELKVILGDTAGLIRLPGIKKQKNKEAMMWWATTGTVVSLIGVVTQTFYATWIFLNVVYWRLAGIPRLREALIAFVEKMAAKFNIHDLLENWADPAYIYQVVSSNRNFVQDTVAKLREKVNRRVDLPDRWT